MKKTTVKVCSDVALVKYWGKKDEVLRLPENGSVSVKLDGLDTVTTVEFDDDLMRDQIMIDGGSDEKELVRVVRHLDRIRKMAGKEVFARVVSENTFPKGTGLSSSGSGFAALTIAATEAIGLKLSQKEMSILARQGSGTACRCVCGGWVEWKDGETSKASFSEMVFDVDYWDVRDVVVVVDEGKKRVSSTEGHKKAQSGLFFEARQKNINGKIKKIKQYIADKDFEKFGELVEAEALEFHAILLTSQPYYLAWYSGTIEVMHAVRELREEGVLAYFTINTGFNVHVLTLPEYESVVVERMEGLDLVKKVLRVKVGGEPEILEEHLF